MQQYVVLQSRKFALATATAPICALATNDAQSSRLFLTVCRISLTSIFPYLPAMIASFGVPSNDIAFWAGACSAIYSLSQALTAIPWGRASDRYGRKPIILLGLLNTLLTSLLWGFSVNLPMAMIARALSGAGNGNVGIIRTMVWMICIFASLREIQC